MEDITDNIAKTHLGKKSQTKEKYDPTLLVAIPRSENRKQYQIQNNALPFLGFDVWNCYEFSALTKNNIPISRLLKLKYPCESEFLVESKSLKLYLNSFNMTNFDENIEKSLALCKKTIEEDLTSLLKTRVEADFISGSEYTKIFENFKNIFDFFDVSNLKIEKFKEAPELLQVQKGEKKEHFLKFDSLRSNCRVTHQPDFGEAFIYYNSALHIKEESLAQYLSSFRGEYHFHEECCEMIYKRLSDILDDEDELFVCLLYTRRGGIDINPVRYSANCSFLGFKNLLDTSVLTKASIKQ